MIMHQVSDCCMQLQTGEVLCFFCWSQVELLHAGGGCFVYTTEGGLAMSQLVLSETLHLQFAAINQQCAM
jgi:hypothetical protein